MPGILAISGSPSPTSRTARVLAHLADRLADAGEHEVTTIGVRDLPAEALISADVHHPAITAVAGAVAAADGIIIATPVYKAAYSGVLKALLDLLPQYALAGKTVLPLATGGTVAHVLAIDYALRPVLTSMGAAHVVPGYFLLDSLIGTAPDGGLALADTAQAGLDTVVAGFLAGLPVTV
ncbi:NADPH-dependent FMN reductase [Longispora sp. K20-0274]|uniref:NADPH-dependent FMN reductase n=1 Tax=Longispora sp. K20-0274 TaxID=3088255 RepID=UPI00399A7006